MPKRYEINRLSQKIAIVIGGNSSIGMATEQPMVAANNIKIDFALIHVLLITIVPNPIVFSEGGASRSQSKKIKKGVNHEHKYKNYRSEN